MKKDSVNIENEEKTPEDIEREQYGGHTLKELLQVPVSLKLLDVYLEDKYSVFKVDEEKFKPLIDNNNHYCLTNKNNRCMCSDFRLQDYEGTCKCGRYTKKLNDEESFIKKRIASLKRGEKA